MSPDEAALIRLWKEKRGEAEPEDLSGNLIVQLGVATEPLNRTWYERNAGRAVTDVQRWVRHPVHRYLAATLDGFVNALDAVQLLALSSTVLLLYWAAPARRSE